MRRLNEIPDQTNRIEKESRVVLTQEEELKLRVKIEILPNGCWRWLPSKITTKKPQTAFQGKTIEVCHLLFKIHVGQIIKPWKLCQICGNKSCVNPYHHYAGTIADNSVDWLLEGAKLTKVDSVYINGTRFPITKTMQPQPKSDITII